MTNLITKSKKMKKLFLLIILSTNIIQAQQEKDTVRTEVIDVTRSFNPTVQDAYKLAVNPDSIRVVEKKVPVNFEIQSVPVASTFMPEKGAMKKFQFATDYRDELNSYVQAGGGNYTHILFDSYIHYPVTEELSTSLNLNHFSTQGNDFDRPYYNTNADILLNYKKENSKFGLDLGYLNELTKLPLLLGGGPIYNPKRNIFNFGVNGSFKDLLIKDFDINYKTFWDDIENSENKLSLNSKFIFPINNVKINTDLRADLVTGTATTSGIGPMYPVYLNYSNFDLGVMPSFVYVNDNLNVKLGAKIFYQKSDTDYKNVQFFPDILANFNIVYEKLSIYGGLNGDIYQTSFIKSSRINPYLVNEQLIIPELMPIEIFGGIKGAFSSNFAYKVKMGFRQLKNHPFYNTSLIYGLLFDDLKQSYFSSGIDVGIGKKLNFKFDFTYYQNNAEHLSTAYYIPDYSIKSTLNFRPINKLTFNLSMFSLGSRSYNETDSLSPFTDLNLEIRYKLTNDFTAFVLGNNLLNKAYSVYAHYPVEKLQIQAGFMYKFRLAN